MASSSSSINKPSPRISQAGSQSARAQSLRLHAEVVFPFEIGRHRLKPVEADLTRTSRSRGASTSRPTPFGKAALWRVGAGEEFDAVGRQLAWPLGRHLAQLERLGRADRRPAHLVVPRDRRHRAEHLLVGKPVGRCLHGRNGAEGRQGLDGRRGQVRPLRFDLFLEQARRIGNRRALTTWAK